MTTTSGQRRDAAPLDALEASVILITMAAAIVFFMVAPLFTADNDSLPERWTLALLVVSALSAVAGVALRGIARR